MINGDDAFFNLNDGRDNEDKAFFNLNNDNDHDNEDNAFLKVE